MSLGHISDSDVSELRRSVSGCEESGVEICTAAVCVVQPEVLAAREQVMICRQQAGFALKLISVLIFSTLIYHRPSVYWGEKDAELYTWVKYRMKKSLGAQPELALPSEESFSNSLKFIMFLFVQAAIKTGNKIIQLLPAMICFFHNLNDWVHERKR